MRSLERYIAALTLALTLLFGGQAQAISVAIFPVDDLSQDFNSMSSEMQKFVAGEVYKRGLEVVPYEKVLDYIATRRIRQIGFLDTVEIMNARSALEVDLILLASVCQQDRKSGAFGMTMSLVRTSDGRAIWANSKGVSLIDEQRFLGVNSPQNFKDLLPILARKLFAEWPADLNFTAGREFAGEQIAAVKETAYTQVESVFFTPKFVKPGQEVRCTIRFKNKHVTEDGAKIFVKVGNRVYLASSEDGIYYKAAWISPGGANGEPIKVASIGDDTLIMKGVWTGDAKDANYPVSLVFDWASGKREESYLGSYVVDSIPPKALLKLQGKVVDGIVSFRNNLPVSIRFKRHEPIKRWEFMITDSNGYKVLSERGTRGVPESLVWNGKTFENVRADSGIYNVSLKVWDRADNESQVAEKVLLLDSELDVDINVEKVGADLIATLSPKDRVPVTAWRMELWDQNNTLLTTIDGESLPAEVKIDELADIVDKDKIACILALRDSLGSRSKREIPGFFAKIDDGNGKDLQSAGEESQFDEWEADF